MEAVQVFLTGSQPEKCEGCKYNLLPEHQRQTLCETRCPGRNSGEIGFIGQDLFFLHLRGLGGEQLTLDAPYYAAIGYLRMLLIKQLMSSISPMTMMPMKAKKAD